jgi:hypothetical protein
LKPLGLSGRVIYMGMTRYFPYPLIMVIFFLGAPRWAWTQSADVEGIGGAADPAALIGLTLEDMVARFGAPDSVYAVRGLETWQDDVVFVYGDREFYLYRDRVWQLGLKSAYGVTLGDSRSVLPLLLGDDIQVFDEYTLFTLPGRGWPLAIRCNVDAGGAVSAIFIYRSDF